jgi:metal transporter CNNM
MALGLAKVLLLALGQMPFVRAAPFYTPHLFSTAAEEEGKAPEDAELWINLTVAVLLVLLGGVFAGLTIALMGQDEIYLQVIRDSGEGAEKTHASKVLNLLNKGKHWVLVTLLLGNVITNETLPIVLDRSLGGGWPAVLGSTVLIGTYAMVWLFARPVR